jgi:hypothetical protein
MREGEEFKRFDDIFAPDPSTLAFSVLDDKAASGARLPTLRTITI